MALQINNSGYLPILEGFALRILVRLGLCALVYHVFPSGLRVIHLEKDSVQTRQDSLI